MLVAGIVLHVKQLAVRCLRAGYTDYIDSMPVVA